MKSRKFWIQIRVVVGITATMMMLGSCCLRTAVSFQRAAPRMATRRAISCFTATHDHNFLSVTRKSPHQRRRPLASSMLATKRQRSTTVVAANGEQPGGDDLALLPFDGPLTRSKVRRMRVKDLRDELKRRGHAEATVSDIKKDNLVALLWDDLTTTTTTHSTANQSSSKLNRLDTTVTSVASEEEISVSQEESKRLEPETIESSTLEDDDASSKAKSATTSLSLDPERKYTLRSKGIADVSSNGTGVGVTLLDSEHHNVVWQTQQYLPGSRSKFEAAYTALVIGLKFAIRRFGLRHVVLELDEDVLVKQLTGIFPVLKETLQPMYYQVVSLRDELEELGSFAIEIVGSSHCSEIQVLAMEAVDKKKSSALSNEHDYKTLLIEKALLIDPMGRDYKGPSTTTEPEKQATTDDKQPIPSDEPVPTKEPMSAVEKNKEFYEQLPPVPWLDQGDDVEESGLVTAMKAPTIDPTKTYKLMFDGGSRGNPGIAGAGMVLYDSDTDQEVWHGWKYIEKATNNQAEYTGILMGLQHARDIGVRRIQCLGDSELIVKQLTGVYKVKSEMLQDLYQETKALLNDFEKVELKHIYRDENKRADELANEAMDNQNDFGFDLSNTVDS